MKKNFYIKVVLSGLRPYRKTIMFVIFEDKFIRHICSYMGIPMVHRFSACSA